MLLSRIMSRLTRCLALMWFRVSQCPLLLFTSECRPVASRTGRTFPVLVEGDSL